jgi:predicted amidohydrolase
MVGNVAHLLLYPTSSGYSTDVRQLGELLGLGSASAQMVEVVDPSRCSASVAADGWSMCVQEWTKIAAIPTNALWCAAAEHRKYLMLTLGVMPEERAPNQHRIW